MAQIIIKTIIAENQEVGMNILLIIFVSLFTLFVVSSWVMKSQMKIINKWMGQFFNGEFERIKKY